jgi:uncharacterized membrane protein
MTSPTTASDRRILIARFDTRDGAEASVGRLKLAHVRLGNVAHIEKNDAGEVKFAESQDWGIGKSALIGAVAALILPGIGLFLGAAAGGLAAYFIDAGFPDALLNQAGTGMLQPGQSALVALVHGEDMVNAEAAIRDAHGTVLGHGDESDLARALDSARANPAP